MKKGTFHSRCVERQIHFSPGVFPSQRSTVFRINARWGGAGSGRRNMGAS